MQTTIIEAQNAPHYMQIPEEIALEIGEKYLVTNMSEKNLFQTTEAA